MDKKDVKPCPKDNSTMGQHGDNLRFGILQSQSKSTEAIYTFLLLKIRFTQLRLHLFVLSKDEINFHILNISFL